MVAIALVSALAPAAARAGGRSPGLRSRLGLVDACAMALPGHVRCDAVVVADANGKPHATPAPKGFGPADLQAAYGLTAAAASAGGGRTVAVVDAFDDPTAESDLAIYRASFGLPPCTAASGCFRKVDQRGGSAYPPGDAGWGMEVSLDLDMVSAACPNCRVLLVEADTTDIGALAGSVDTAARLGATAIANSYGGPESSTQRSSDGSYDHPGIAITASTGDNGYGAQYPSSSPLVTAVGGTSLRRSAPPRGWSETAWHGSGSGCSAVEPKPSWQHDDLCAGRTTGDVAMVADPATGVAVYDSYNTPIGLLGLGGTAGGSGWMVEGGTSVGAPLAASIYALAGNTVGLTGAQALYVNRAKLNDVTVGSNCMSSASGSFLGGLLSTGPSCPDNALDHAGPGYDGPTGNGSPNGLAGF